MDVFGLGLDLTEVTKSTLFFFFFELVTQRELTQFYSLFRSFPFLLNVSFLCVLEPLKRRWLLSPDGVCTYFDPPKGEKEDWSDQLERFVPLTVTAGTMVVLHGHLVHWSDENRSDRSRHAYTWRKRERRDSFTLNSDLMFVFCRYDQWKEQVSCR